jgi:hypothetical protein
MKQLSKQTAENEVIKDLIRFDNEKPIESHSADSKIVVLEHYEKQLIPLTV